MKTENVQFILKYGFTKNTLYLFCNDPSPAQHFTSTELAESLKKAEDLKGILTSLLREFHNRNLHLKNLNPNQYLPSHFLKNFMMIFSLALPILKSLPDKSDETTQQYLEKIVLLLVNDHWEDILETLNPLEPNTKILSDLLMIYISAFDTHYQTKRNELEEEKSERLNAVIKTQQHSRQMIYQKAKQLLEKMTDPSEIMRLPELILEAQQKTKFMTARTGKYSSKARGYNWKGLEISSSFYDFIKLCQEKYHKLTDSDLISQNEEAKIFLYTPTSHWSAALFKANHLIQHTKQKIASTLRF